ncbi:hypothetical protein HDU76_006678 [Blyttiomyces sp. JEL0837]|nr:hypothetical protein HDU76_006678 [Blyttiomyces sp. JEL0837]
MAFVPMDFNSSAEYYIQVWSLCEEAQKQQQLHVTTPVPSSQESRPYLNVSEGGLFYHFIDIKPGPNGNLQYECVSRTLSSFFHPSMQLAAGTLAMIYQGPLYLHISNTNNMRLMLGLVDHLEAIRSAGELSRQELENMESPVGKLMLQMMVPWLQCANCHIHRFNVCDDENSPDHAFVVKEQASLKRCSKCKRVAYCSVDCQKQEWSRRSGHKRVCRAPDDFWVGDIVILIGMHSSELQGYREHFGQIVKEVEPGPMNAWDETMYLVADPRGVDRITVRVKVGNMALRMTDAEC